MNSWVHRKAYRGEPLDRGNSEDLAAVQRARSEPKTRGMGNGISRATTTFPVFFALRRWD